MRLLKNVLLSYRAIGRCNNTTLTSPGWMEFAFGEQVNGAWKSHRLPSESKRVFGPEYPGATVAIDDFIDP